MQQKRTSPRALQGLVWSLVVYAGLAQAQFACFPEDVMPENMFPSVKLETTKGDIVIELNRLRAPVTSNNFLRYVTSGFYDGTIFHRVMNGFVIQAGGYTPEFEERETFDPIINESGNGLKNLPMTVAMARYDDPHTATSQFYINLAANASLDPSAKNWGYAVFGSVISGQEVVEIIASVATGYNEYLDAQDVPQSTIQIKKAYVLDSP